MSKLFREHVLTGHGDTPLDSLLEQLWRAPVASGDVRIVANPRRSKAWHDEEQYWILPSLAKPRMLIPRGNRKVTAASLLAYRRLRPKKVSIGRGGLGWMARSGLPLSRDTLSVQSRAGLATKAPLPLAEISSSLGSEQLSAAIGIRLGDNRKATLQLFDHGGRPSGYAKIAWDAASRDYVDTERDVLSAVAGGSASMRVPALAGEGVWDGYPYLVSTPLPEDVRAVRGRVGAPTPQELFSLCAVHRFGTVADSAHFKALGWRLGELVDTTGENLGEAARRLESLLRMRNSSVPIAERWHGDMVPWNMARESSGTLWCWDWETSEPDAVAGLDAWHWAVSVRRESQGSFSQEDWSAAGRQIQPYLQAAAIPRSAWDDIAGVYALVVAERAWSLAAARGDWSSSWLTPANLVGLLNRVAGELSEPGTPAP